MTLRDAFNAFLDDPQDLEGAIVKSTMASFANNSYSLELFPDGSYRVLADNDIGNLYDSPGLIIGVPALNDDEWDDDPDFRFFDNAIEALKATFDNAIEQLTNA